VPIWGWGEREKEGHGWVQDDEAVACSGFRESRTDSMPWPSSMDPQSENHLG
jgi:hypothetical protein